MTENVSEIKRLAQKYLEKFLSGLVITDGGGFIIYISESCRDLYGINKAKCIGKHISYLEEQGTFQPSAGARVLRERKKATVIQPDRYGEQLLVTGVPIFDGDGELKYVITYSSWNMSYYHEIREQYEKLKEENEKFVTALNVLRQKDMRFEIIAKSEKMKSILNLVDKIASADISVIIKGEPGSGKGVLAKEIHRRSDRVKGPYLQVACSAYPNNVLQDELFGYSDKTDGGTEKMGLLEMASNGTMLIEDIDALDQDNQNKLLQLIKNGYYFKPGSDNIIHINTRILATTAKDLMELVQRNEFNKELFYRLNIASINQPSLRERKQDVVPLLEHFLQKFNQKYNRKKKFSEQAYTLLSCYEWPGNVCELKYLVQKMVLTVEPQVIQGYHLPGNVSPYANSRYRSEVDLKEYLDFYEKRIVTEAYQKHGTTVGVAKFLGISQATAVRKLQKHIEGYVGSAEKSHPNA